MTLRTSLVISGDSAGAEAALKGTAAGLDQNAEAAKRTSAAYAVADKAIERLAAAQVTAKAETTAAKAAFDAGEISIRDYNARLLETKTALGLVEVQHRAAVTGIRQLNAANDAAGPSLAQARAGYQNFGRQIQDVALMAASPGINLGTIITTQGGQIADAVAQMGGRFSGLASFLAGPWGAAVIVGTGLLVNFAQAHLRAGDETDKHKAKQLSLADALDKSRFATDEARKAIADYNAEQERARDNADAMIKKKLEDADADLKQAIATREKTQAEIEYQIASRKYVTNVGSGTGAIGGGDAALAGSYLAESGLRSRLADNQKRIAETEEARRNLRIQDAVRDAKAAADPIQAINNKYDDMAEKAKFAASKTDALSLSLKGLLSELEKQRKAELDTERKNQRTEKGAAGAAARRARSAANNAEYGEDTASKLSGIRDQFSDLPSAVEKANRAVSQLDGIVSHLERRKPPGFKGMIADAQALKPLIEQSLLKPFDDYLEKSREAAQIDRLMIAGRDEEAAALRVVLSLKEKTKPLDQEQLATVRATVQAEERRSLLLRDQRALIQGNIRAVHDMRDALEQTVADALRGKLSVEKVLSSIGNSFINLTSQRIVEQMFGNTLRAMEEQARGGGKIENAATQMAKAMDVGAAAITRLADTANGAAGRLSGSQAGSSPANDNAASNDNGTGDDIVVTGKRLTRLAGADPASLLVDMADALLRDLGHGIPKTVGDAVKGTLQTLEKALPHALEGALIGSSASRIILGDRGAGGSVGSAIGGALGQKAGEKLLGGVLSSISKGLGSFAGPIGSIVGGLLGGVVGGLFKSAPRASASISSASSSVSSSGNNSEAQQAVSAVAGSVQSAINQIVKAVGGTPGDYSVGIGSWNGSYRVSKSGLFDPSAKYFDKDHPGDFLPVVGGEDEALRVALRDAIEDGAVKGISAAMQRALQSTTDIDKAVAEALKVRDVEQLIGGLTYQLQKQFTEFDAQASERVRIARKYGFDVLKIEELNAKQRLDLQTKLAADQVGSLQSLVDEITAGSLFEGSSVDQRRLLLDKIAAAKTEADAGTEGSADKLAQLLQQLNTVSKSAFGTTGGFAADQSTILDAARDTIAKANQRVADAGKASDPALATTNQYLDESNDQLARIAASLNVSVEYLKTMALNTITNFAALAASAGYR